ncbi:hypothetical protein D770_08485 [Flammeovirgaceae bacterium 311]|nr:hypothetical protein D770_08485 [Flammeovirgaceae bacterium 311]
MVVLLLKKINKVQLQRTLICLSFFLLFIQPLNAQQIEGYRSDSLNFSVQARYLIVSFGAGVELPFRQHSFGLQAGFNGVPIEGNIYNEFNIEKIAALEYKRYYPWRGITGKHFYYGSYLIFKNTEHGSPHDADWEGQWYMSHSVNAGPLWGIKSYKGSRLYSDYFMGLHGGWQWGELKWDNRDPDTHLRYPTYADAAKVSWGIRVGLSLGFHPVRTKPMPE